MSNNINTCKHCGKQYERGFFGTGPKYCSRECNRKARYPAVKIRNRKRYVRKDKDCAECGRNIKAVGIRRITNKYCSPTCMALGQMVKKTSIPLRN